MKKSVFLSLSILEISKTVMYEFRDDNVKLKYNKKAELCYMDKDFSSFIVHLKAEEVYKDIVKNIDTSNYRVRRTASKKKKTKKSLV